MGQQQSRDAQKPGGTYGRYRVTALLYNSNERPLLPAVHANSTLRELVAADASDDDEDEEEGAAREADALVAARTQPAQG